MITPDVAIRQEDNGDIVWLEQFLEDHASLVDVTVRRIQAVLAGVEKPQSPGNLRKCRPCRFKVSCPVCAKP